MLSNNYLNVLSARTADRPPAEVAQLLLLCTRHGISSTVKPRSFVFVFPSPTFQVSTRFLADVLPDFADRKDERGIEISELLIYSMPGCSSSRHRWVHWLKRQPSATDSCLLSHAGRRFDRPSGTSAEDATEESNHREDGETYCYCHSFPPLDNLQQR